MAISDFIDYLEFEKKYAKNTILAYQKDIATFSDFINQEYGQSDIAHAHYAQIRSWIVMLVNQGLSNRSINRKISSLKTYYKYLLKTKQITHSPLASHKALKTTKKIQTPFSKKEIDNALKLLPADNFESARDKLIITLFYSTGIRRAELIAITLDTIDLEAKTLKVTGKRNKERILPLLDLVVVATQKYLNFRKEVSSNKSSNYLFISQKGVKLNETFVYRIINNYFSQVSGKIKRSPHILRHSFATHLLDEGASLNAVKELLGHSSLASTEVYTHSSLKELRKAHSNFHPRNKPT